MQIQATNADIESSMIEASGKNTAQVIRVSKATPQTNIQIKNSVAKGISNERKLYCNWKLWKYYG